MRGTYVYISAASGGH